LVGGNVRARQNQDEGIGIVYERYTAHRAEDRWTLTPE
jgi:hypothetical protein